VTDILVLDFETYYDQKFSLSKLTTEEYIRDPQFETIGIAVKRNEEPTEWFSGTKAQTKRWLDKWDWANSVAVAHNAMFDMAILNWCYDIRPKRIADTLSMLRAIDGPHAGNSLAKAVERYGLGEKGTEVINALGKRRLDFTDEDLERYGEYCINDVELTQKLFEILAPLMPVSELRLIDLTIRMFTEPTLVLDKQVLTKHVSNVRSKKAELMKAVEADKDALMSNPKLALLLRDMGVVPPTKVSPKTGKEAYAFAKSDEAFKALLEHPNPRVQAVVAARLGVKSTLEETRTERFINIADRGPLPVPLRYYAAHTGRWGGDDKVNLQNLPRKSPLKKSMLAPEGYVFIDCDSSQIEARTLAWLAGQDDLVEFFEKNNAEVAAGVEKMDMQFDPYKIMASEIYGKPVNEINEHPERFIGKTTILGCGYGMGSAKFKMQLETMGVSLSSSECASIVFKYRDQFSRIPALWEQGDVALEALMSTRTAPLGKHEAVLIDMFGVRLPNGMYLRYDNLRKQLDPKSGREQFVYDVKKGRATLPTYIYGGKLIENVCQALARIIIGEQMLMVARKYRVVMTVHDAVGVIAPIEEADKARAFVEACMRMRPKWAPTLPLNCESKIGASYGG
jgi:DNA polymerase